MFYVNKLLNTLTTSKHYHFCGNNFTFSLITIFTIKSLKHLLTLNQQKTLIFCFPLKCLNFNAFTAVTLTELILFLALSDEVVDVVQTFLMQISPFRKELIRFLSRFYLATVL